MLYYIMLYAESARPQLVRLAIGATEIAPPFSMKHISVPKKKCP